MERAASSCPLRSVPVLLWSHDRLNNFEPENASFLRIPSPSEQRRRFHLGHKRAAALGERRHAENPISTRRASPCQLPSPARRAGRTWRVGDDPAHLRKRKTHTAAKGNRNGGAVPAPALGAALTCDPTWRGWRPFLGVPLVSGPLQGRPTPRCLGPVQEAVLLKPAAQKQRDSRAPSWRLQRDPMEH